MILHLIWLHYVSDESCVRSHISISFIKLFFEFLDIKGTKPGLTSVAVINLNHCREYTVEQEPKDDTLEPLYPIDINKVSIQTKAFQKKKFRLF
jgi:hypothetical protein